MLIVRRAAARTMRAPRSVSPMAIAWRTAPPMSPRSSSARHARSCADHRREAPSELRRALRNDAKRWWYRYQPLRSSSATTNRFAASRRSSIAAASSTPVTAAHSSASKASSTDVSTRKSTSSAGRLARTSLTRKSLTARSVLDKARQKCSRPARCNAIATSWAPAGQPSVSSCSRTSSSSTTATSSSSKNADISDGPKRRSGPRSSSSSPWSRKRANDNGGSDLVPTTSRKLAGNAWMKAVSITGAGAARWRSSTTMTPGPSMAPSSFATATAAS